MGGPLSRGFGLAGLPDGRASTLIAGSAFQERTRLDVEVTGQREDLPLGQRPGPVEHRRDRGLRDPDRHRLLAPLPLRRGPVTPAGFFPGPPVVFGMVHHAEYEDAAPPRPPGVADPTDQAIPVVADIEDHAVPDLVSRRIRLFQFGEV